MNGNNYQKPASTDQYLSNLLSTSDKQKIQQFLPTSWKCIGSAVVQLFFSPDPYFNQWEKACCGIIMFIKDSEKRSFYFRILNLRVGSVIWEQEIYRQFVYNNQHPTFHTFESDKNPAGLNFADETDAKCFSVAINKHLETQRKKREQKRQNNRNKVNIPSSTTKTTAVTAIPQTPKNSNQVNIKSKESIKRNKKGKGTKITKDDIGDPTNFKHIEHVGFGSNTPNTETTIENTFDFNNPDFRAFLSRAGVNPNDVLTGEVKQLICEIVVKAGGFKAIVADNKKYMRNEPTQRNEPPQRPLPPPPISRNISARERVRAPPPPQPHQNDIKDRKLPPPPPPSQNTHKPAPLPPRIPQQLPSRASNIVESVPPNPPPPSSYSLSLQKNYNSPPTIKSSPFNINDSQEPVNRMPNQPPPPPPPTSSNIPPPPPPPPPEIQPFVKIEQKSLMDQIRSQQEGSLRHVPDKELKPAENEDSRGNLLDAIRSGVALKSVEDNNIRPQEPEKAEGLAGILQAALKNRLDATKSNQTDESSNGEDSDDDWD